MPSVIEAVSACVEAGAPGITNHPRADARHVTTSTAEIAQPHRSADEWNTTSKVTRDPTSLIWSTACDPINARWVPVRPGDHEPGGLVSPDASGGARKTIDGGSRAIRVSLFVDPEDAAVRRAGDLGADRIELYTEPFARAF